MLVFTKITFMGVEVGCTQKSPIEIVLTSSLSDECYLLKVGSFSFVSPVIDSAVSKPIFDIKATEDKTKTSTLILSGSGKNVLSFGSMATSASPKISGGGFG